MKVSLTYGDSKQGGEERLLSKPLLLVIERDNLNPESGGGNNYVSV